MISKFSETFSALEDGTRILQTEAALKRLSARPRKDYRDALNDLSSALSGSSTFPAREPAGTVTPSMEAINSTLRRAADPPTGPRK